MEIKKNYKNEYLEDVLCGITSEGMLAEIAISDHERIPDSLRTALSKNLITSTLMSPELAKMTIKVLQEYLKHIGE